MFMATVTPPKIMVTVTPPKIMAAVAIFSGGVSEAMIFGWVIVVM
jgi:hypothetical protein